MSAAITFADIVAVGWVSLSWLWLAVYVPLFVWTWWKCETDAAYKARLAIKLIAEGHSQSLGTIANSAGAAALRVFLRSLVPAAWLLARALA